MNSIDNPIVSDDEYYEVLSASVDPLRPPSGRSRLEWTEIQRARYEYIKEWEEDLRYASELANEGM